MPIGKYIYCTFNLESLIKKGTNKSQMPIGKYIYCTAEYAAHKEYWDSHKCLSASTFTVLLRDQCIYELGQSQMPIGKYIYCTLLGRKPEKTLLRSQMPIGKYIYCTQVILLIAMLAFLVTNAYRQVHLLYPSERSRFYGQPIQGHKCLSASTFTVQEAKGEETLPPFQSQMPIGKYIYCTP